MKKLILLMLSLSLFGVSFAYGPRQLCSTYPDYAIEGPNHKDYLELVKEKPLLKDALYRVSADMYYGPQTLASLQMRYDLCHAM